MMISILKKWMEKKWTRIGLGSFLLVPLLLNASEDDDSLEELHDLVKQEVPVLIEKFKTVTANFEKFKSKNRPISEVLDLELKVSSFKTRIISALEKKGPAARVAIPILFEALGDENENVRNTAEWAIARIGGESVIPDVIKALGDQRIYVPSHAQIVLVRIGPPAIPAIIKVLTDNNRRVRWNAVDVLSKFGAAAEGAIPALITVLKKDKDENIRVKAIEALQRIDSNIDSKDERVFSAFINAFLKDDAQWVRFYAENALKKINPNYKESVDRVLKMGVFDKCVLWLRKLIGK